MINDDDVGGDVDDDDDDSVINDFMSTIFLGWCIGSCLYRRICAAITWWS